MSIAPFFAGATLPTVRIRHIPLEVRGSVLLHLASGLRQFGVLGQPADWSTIAIWLCTENEHYLASASPRIVSGGFTLSTLSIESPGEFLARLPLDADDFVSDLPAPQSLTTYSGPAEAFVLEREVEMPDASSCKIACGVLFKGKSGDDLLVATYCNSAALALTQEPGQIRAWCDVSKLIPASDYALGLAP